MTNRLLQRLFGIEELKEMIMANAEQVAALNTKLDQIEQTLRDEADEIKAAIEAAGAGDGEPDPALDALNARLDAVNAAVEALAAAPAPPSE